MERYGYEMKIGKYIVLEVKISRDLPEQSPAKDVLSDKTQSSNSSFNTY